MKKTKEIANLENIKINVLQEAKFYFDRGNYHKAMDILQSERELTPPPPEWEIMKCRIYQELGLLSEAWKCLRRAEMLTKNTDYQLLASIYFNKGRILQLREKYKESFRMYETAREYSSNCKDRHGVGRCLFNMGLILSDLKEYDRALILLKESLLEEDTPYTRQFYHLNRGYIEIERENLKEAEKNFKKAFFFAQKCKNSEIELRALEKLGECAERKNRYRTALKFYEKGISILERIMLPFPSPEITGNFLKFRPNITSSALNLALKTKNLKKAFYLSARSKSLTLVEKTRTDINFTSNEIEEIAFHIFKSSRKRLPKAWWTKWVKKRPLRLRYPKVGECFMDFYRLENEGGIILLLKDRLFCVSFPKKKWRIIKNLSLNIEREFLNYGADAMIEEEVEELRFIFQKVIPDEPIKKLLISPTGFLHILPWQSIFPEFEIIICPSFLMVKAKKQKCEIPFLGLLCAEELEWTSREFTVLKKLFPDGVFLKGEKVTKRAFFQFAPYAKIIHIIAHSPVYFKNREVGIELPKKNLLSVFEISMLPMKSSLVSLGVCASAKGKIDRITDEVLSIAYAFLLAGVNRVIASPFPVDDRTAFHFFVNFYSSRTPSWSKRARTAFLQCLSSGIPTSLSGTFLLYRNLW